MLLVDLNYNFEFDWFVELSDNKLSDNNLASELVENRSFLNESQLRKLRLASMNSVTLGTNDERMPPQKTKFFAYVNSWK